MKRLLILLPITFLFLTLGSTSFAQMMLGPKGVGAFLGYVNPEHVDATLGFGAVVDMGTLTPMLGLDLEILYWSKSEGPSDRKISWRDIVLCAHARYRFSLPGSPVKPYMGGGIGPHFVKHENEQSGKSETDTKFGLHLLAGAEYEVSPKVAIFGEWRYAIVSDINQFAIFAGAKYKLGQ